jgi:hypothetical protein
MAHLKHSIFSKNYELDEIKIYLKDKNTMKYDNQAAPSDLHSHKKFLINGRFSTERRLLRANRAMKEHQKYLDIRFKLL